MNTRKNTSSSRPSYIPDDPLLTAREGAVERGQGLSTFWRDVKNGRVPLPIYIGRKSPRWRRSEILASIEVCKEISFIQQGNRLIAAVHPVKKQK